MVTIEIDLSEDEAKQLNEAAAGRDVTVAALLQRWVRERLVHELERAGGGGRPMSPRAQQKRGERHES